MEEQKKEPKRTTAKKDDKKTPIEKKTTAKPTEPKPASPTPPPPPDLNIEEEKISAMSITALCFGILGAILCCYGLNLILGTVAVILGFIEKKNITEGDSTLKSLPLANWAVGLGFAGVGIFVIQIVLVFIFGASVIFLGATQ
ncbi:DUF4190 domain-containing protein [Candidatus Dependentiae bacterium]|nr:DUF4190 domain-containing protein [Candidatus Dependentiae bacterium]